MINKILKDIEEKNNVKIVFAAFCGSTSYGLDNQDSDVDIRYIFVRRIEDYLACNYSPAQTLSYHNDQYDINGYDIRHFCGQIFKSNLNYLETINSKHIIKEFTDNSFMTEMKVLSSRVMNRNKLYDALNGMYNGYSKEDTLRKKIKSALGRIRMYCSMKWLAKFDNHPREFPPLDFYFLINDTLRTYCARVNKLYDKYKKMDYEGCLEGLDEILKYIDSEEKSLYKEKAWTFEVIPDKEAEKALNVLCASKIFQYSIFK